MKNDDGMVKIARKFVDKLEEYNNECLSYAIFVCPVGSPVEDDNVAMLTNMSFEDKDPNTFSFIFEHLCKLREVQMFNKVMDEEGEHTVSVRAANTMCGELDEVTTRWYHALQPAWVAEAEKMPQGAEQIELGKWMCQIIMLHAARTAVGCLHSRHEQAIKNNDPIDALDYAEDLRYMLRLGSQAAWEELHAILTGRYDKLMEFRGRADLDKINPFPNEDLGDDGLLEHLRRSRQ